MNAILKINGQVKEFQGHFPSTLAELLQILEINEATVVAEVDGEIIPRARFNTAALKEGVTIELVRFVGGG